MTSVYLVIMCVGFVAFVLGVLVSDNQFSHSWKVQIGKLWEVAHRSRLLSEGYSYAELAPQDPGQAVTTALWLVSWAAAFRVRARARQPIVCD